MLEQELELEWPERSNHLPRINGRRYMYIRYSPQLRFNNGVPRFVCQNVEYGCFEGHPLQFPQIQHIYPLQILENRYHTYYFTSLTWDGNPYFQVLFILIDRQMERMYESWVVGRASAECSIEVDLNTYGFTLHNGNQTPLYLNEYNKKLEAGLQCIEAMRDISPHRHG